MLNGLILRGVERLGDHIGDESLGLVGIHFVELVVAALGVALGVETDGLHDQRDATRGDGLATIGDHLCDGGRVETLEGLTGLGLTEATADELFLVGHNTEILVLLLHALFFGFIKPIGKAIAVRKTGINSFFFILISFLERASLFHSNTNVFKKLYVCMHVSFYMYIIHSKPKSR